mmetsp:Transcript_87417/g.178630  ORF Transcript_87417/g.178630 Transcript_87417/m.178630 type:complete len:271 (-) Transcript_87417:112-924(-)
MMVQIHPGRQGIPGVPQELRDLRIARGEVRAVATHGRVEFQEHILLGFQDHLVEILCVHLKACITGQMWHIILRQDVAIRSHGLLGTKACEVRVHGTLGLLARAKSTCTFRFARSGRTSVHHISDAAVATIMQGIVRNLMFVNVLPNSVQIPESQRIDLQSPRIFLQHLHLLPLRPLRPSAPRDPHCGAQETQGPRRGFYLGEVAVLFKVILPQIFAVGFVEAASLTFQEVFGIENRQLHLRIMLGDVVHVLVALWKKVQGVNQHHRSGF